MPGINGVGISLALGGAVFAYSAVKGKSISKVARNLLAGQSPSSASNDFPINGTPGSVGGASGGAAAAVAYAQAQLGKPYVFGAAGPGSFDCSGLTMRAWQAGGASLTHFTTAQYAQTTHRPFAQAQPGDLVFWQNRALFIHHVGLYIGNGQVIDAEDVGIPVRVRAVSAGESELMANVGAFPASSVAVAASTGGAAVGGNPGQNQALGKRLAAAYGWDTGQNWSDLVSLWNQESGWSNTADTRVTGSGGDSAASTVFAYGIAQARPASKYPRAGQPPSMGGSADPASQINWGLSYIRSRYGSPSAAWANELAHGYY